MPPPGPATRPPAHRSMIVAVERRPEAGKPGDDHQAGRRHGSRAGTGTVRDREPGGRRHRWPPQPPCQTRARQPGRPSHPSMIVAVERRPEAGKPGDDHQAGRRHGSRARTGAVRGREPGRAPSGDASRAGRRQGPRAGRPAASVAAATSMPPPGGPGTRPPFPPFDDRRRGTTANLHANPGPATQPPVPPFDDRRHGTTAGGGETRRRSPARASPQIASRHGNRQGPRAGPGNRQGPRAGTARRSGLHPATLRGRAIPGGVSPPGRPGRRASAAR